LEEDDEKTRAVDGRGEGEGGQGGDADSTPDKEDAKGAQDKKAETDGDKEVDQSAEKEGERDKEPEETKGGRVLSKANENLLRDTKELIGGVLEMDVSNAVKAMLKEANNKLEKVLEAVGADEDLDQRGVSTNDAMTALLAHAGIGELLCTKRHIDGILHIHRINEEASMYNTLLECDD
jgi:hypothetical protein